MADNRVVGMPRERVPGSAKDASPIRGAPLFWTGILFLSTTLCVVGPAWPASADAPGKPADKAACVPITRYGARSNGADATRAIQRAIDAVKTDGARCVYAPAGTYGTSKITGGVKMIGDGDASVLYAPDPANRQVKLAGTGAGLYSLKIYTVGKKRTDDDEGVWIEEDATNFVVDDVTIDGGNGPGIITYGGSWGRITNNRVANTKSDSIHMSGGAHHVYIAGNKVRNSGDDMIAVVTYAYHPVNTYEILIENNDVADQPWGRGISVVGGENITIRDNRISRSADAGIYIAAESSWATRGVRNVVVRGNRIDECPSAHEEHGQASILVYSDNKFRIENVLLDGNAITDTPTEPIRVQPRHTSNIACRGNTDDGEDIAPSDCGGDAATITGSSVTGTLLGGTTVPLPTRRKSPEARPATLGLGRPLTWAAPRASGWPSGGWGRLLVRPLCCLEQTRCFLGDVGRVSLRSTRHRASGRRRQHSAEIAPLAPPYELYELCRRSKFPKTGRSPRPSPTGRART